MENALSLTHTGVGKKALVAITGGILFGFVIVHLLGNLQVFLGADHLNEYAAFLQSMPKVVWSVRLLLLASLVVHVGLTIDLATKNARARGSRYEVQADVADQDPLMKYARKTMILSGPLVFAFIVFHLAHLTVGAPVVPGYEFVREDVYSNFVHGFRNPWITGFYVFANVLLGFHLYQGGHSLLQSLGLRAPRFDVPIRRAAAAFAALVSLGNVAMPLLVLARVVGGDL
jgi:succinate dehydrogenase / fumarate reductase, cytochrome b subunit